MPKISIIIPVYNAHDTLERCIQSLLEQSMKDIEFIFIDDCSTDNSVEILKSQTAQDQRCLLLQNEKNHGVAYTRKRGIDVAQGMYIFYCDADDYVSPRYCEYTYLAA
jgi:glycosyltransferase involved in cell wall biosynthesis